jgi:hypothetical protein
MVVDHLPTTFSGMTLTVQINKTAQDGLQGLISQVNQLSTSQPPVLAISAQTMQISSLAKNVADFLFHASLLQMKLQTRNPFPSAGALDPGIYVCFAGDTQQDYQQYLQQPTKLSWNGAVLTFNGTAVNGVSYFIIEVDYETSYFAQPLDALNYGASKPWVALYLVAQNEIPNINTCGQAATAQNDIQSHLGDARTLLTQDYGFTDSERDAIADAVYNKLNTAFNSRLAAIDPSSCKPSAVAQANPQPGPGAAPQVAPAPQPAPAAQPPRINLLAPDLAAPDANAQALHDNMMRNLGVGQVMQPTANPSH